MIRTTFLLMMSFVVAASALATTNNDDSCDIGVLPAATLLLPYFEVDFNTPQSSAVTTLFTVQNVSPQPQIVTVTLCTDWAYPALSFSIFLTGYDVQSINLYDLFAHAVIAPGPPSSGGGTSIGTPVPTNPTPGSQPASNTSNPHFLPSVASDCAIIPGAVPKALIDDLRSIFTTGVPTAPFAFACTTAVGGTHAHAIGYLTIDVVATCVRDLPASTSYFANHLLFDNVLTGDYQQLFPGKYALGGPMVHIRAVPEGGAAGAIPGTSLPYTFYDRLTGSAFFRDVDRRQPLPSEFAPRFIQGGTGAFNTSFKIWREAMTGPNPTCDQYARNSSIPLADMIRFDEHENATEFGTNVVFCPPSAFAPVTPVTSMVATSSSSFPPLSTSGDVAGWMFLNLNNGGASAYTVAIGPGGIARDFVTNTSTINGVRQSQAWVLTSMYADPTYAVEGWALALGNGCSPSPKGGAPIGPAPNANP